jgi:hypothetical protein
MRRRELEPTLLYRQPMAMTWGHDETGMVVIPGSGKGKKAKPEKAAKAKAPKPEKAARVRAPEPPRTVAAVPIGLPIATPAAWPVATGTRLAEKDPTERDGGGFVRFLRALLTTVLVVGLAAGGFALGALTELGTEAENYVLGPDQPARDPRVPALEAELAKTQQELAALRAAAAPPAPVVAPAIEVAPDAVSAADPKPEAKRSHRRHRRR